MLTHTELIDAAHEAAAHNKVTEEDMVVFVQGFFLGAICAQEPKKRERKSREPAKFNFPADRNLKETT